MRRWVDAGVAQPDHVHFTGDGYRLLGAALYKEMMDQFATYVKVRNEAIESTLGSTRANPETTPNIQNGKAHENN